MTDTKAQARQGVNGRPDSIEAEEPYWVMQATEPPSGAVLAGKRAIEKAMAALRANQAARREAEAARFQEKMANPVTTEIPKMANVRAGDIRFDPRYQTDERYDERRAKNIAEVFNWEELDPINLNIRPDDPAETAWCYDGRHRTTAVLMRIGPNALVNATVIRVPYEREAALFAEQDRFRKNVPQRIKFIAKMEAGDADALAQQALLDRLGLSIGQRARGRTISLNAFLDCCRIKGLDATEEGLAFVLSAWHGAAESLEEHMVKGVVWFVANRRDDPGYRSQRVGTVLGRESVREVERMAQGRSERLTEHQRIASAIVDLYNRNQRDSFAIPDWNPRKDR